MKTLSTLIQSFVRKHKTLSVYLLFLFLYLAISSGHIGGDGLWIYFTAESLLFDGDFDLSNVKADFGVTELHENFKALQDTIIANRNAGINELYTQYGLLMVLVYALFYSIGHLVSFVIPVVGHDYVTIFFVSLVNSFITALTSVYLYRFALEITGSEKRSLLLAAVFGFGTFVADFAIKSGFSEPMHGLTFFASFYHVYRFKQTGNSTHILFSGLFAAASVLTKFYSVIGIGIISLYLLRVVFDGSAKIQIQNSQIARRLSLIAFYVTPIFIGIALLIGFNYLRYGTLFDQTYSDMYSQNSLFDFRIVHVIARAFNLLISPGKGLLIFAPILFLGFSGFKEFFRTHRDEAALCALVSMTFFLFFSCFIYWHGDWSWGPRYLYIIIPFLILPISTLLAEKTYLTWQKSVKFLFVIGILIQLPSILLNNGDFIRFSQYAGFERYRHTLPQYSPVVVGYVRIASALKRNLSGESIDYPVIYLDINESRFYVTDEIAEGEDKTTRVNVSLKGYDRFDIWMINAWRVVQGRLVAKYALLLVSMLSISVPVIWYLLLRKNLE